MFIFTQGALELGGANAVARHVDHIINSPSDAEVAVGRSAASISRDVLVI
jgi:hypothetical protein